MVRRGLVAIAIVLAATLIGVGGVASGGALQLKANLSGAEEVPPVATDASGKAIFHVNGDRTAIDFKLEFNGTNLLGVAGSHIHCGAAGVNGPVVVFLAGAVPGGFDGAYQLKATLTQENIVNTACGATLEALVESMQEGNTYVNVHSPAFPGGEIRGQIG